MRANYAAGIDTISVPPGLFPLTRKGFDDDGLVGDLDIKDAAIIQGAGPDTTFFDGNGSLTNDHVVHILNTASPVTMTKHYYPERP